MCISTTTQTKFMINSYHEELKINGKFSIERSLRCYGGGSSSGSGNTKNASSSSGMGSATSQSTSMPQLTPSQLLSLYGNALPSMTNAASNAVNSSVAAPALNAANQGAVAGVNAINLNGLSPGESNAVERSLNQSNTSTGNLGLLNPETTVANAMNFGGAFNSKIPLLNSATQTASGVANSNVGALTGTAGIFNPVASNASSPISQSTSSSLFSNAGTGFGTGQNLSSGNDFSCYLTTACCKHRGLLDDCEELTVLRRFRDECVPKPVVERYYQIAPNICVSMQGDPMTLDYIWGEIKECVRDIKRCRRLDAFERYTNMTSYLERKYRV